MQKPQAHIVVSHAQKRESEKKKKKPSNVVYYACVVIFPSLVQVNEIGSAMLDG